MPLKWTVQDSAKLYAIDEWGDGYFGTNAKGRIVAMPTRDESITIDLYEAVLRLKKLGVQTPVTLRFPKYWREESKRSTGLLKRLLLNLITMAITTVSIQSKRIKSKK